MALGKLPTNRRALAQRALPGIAAAIALAWVGFALGFDVYGPSSDELAYHHAAKLQWAWLLDVRSFHPGSLAHHFEFLPEVVVHPTLSRWLAGLGWALLGRPEGLAEGISLRLFSAGAYAVLAGLVVRAALRRYGLLGGLVAAPLFFSLTRLMGHAHLAHTDVLLTTLWFGTSLLVAHERAPSPRRALLIGALLGLTLATKLTGLLLVAAVLAFWALRHRARALAPAALAVLAALLVFLALHPHLWPSPVAGLGGFFARFFSREEAVTIPTYVFGERYFHRVPVWVPAFSLLVATPAVVLALAALAGVARALAARGQSARELVRGLVTQDAFLTGSAFSTLVVASVPTVPAHDLERLFLPLFPFLVLFAAGGVVAAALALHERGALDGAGARAAAVGLLVVLLAPGVVESVRIHPHEPSWVSGLVGGERGAYDAGIDFAFHKNELTTGALRELSVRVTTGQSLYAGYLAEELLRHQLQGRFRTDVRIVRFEDTLGERPPVFQWVLVHARRGFFLAPFEEELYGKREPEWSIELRGVPLIELHRVHLTR